jgi:streptomycin 6-kinase
VQHNAFQIPPSLKWLEESPEGRSWLSDLPRRVQICSDRWNLRLEAPFPGSHVSLTLPATRPDKTPAVLKLQFPHSESEHEAEALRRWNGRGAVQLFEWEPKYHALLMEKCDPGDPLSEVAPDQALDALVELLPRLWVEADAPFFSLCEESAKWAQHLPILWQRARRPFEGELLDAALEALHTLKDSQGQQVLLNQDLHGGNVLRARRQPWLVIDPKPLVGEREFSIAPIIRSRELGHSQEATINRLNKLTGSLRLNRERARLWAFAQTLAWSFEGNYTLKGHVETARWLKSA